MLRIQELDYFRYTPLSIFLRPSLLSPCVQKKKNVLFIYGQVWPCGSIINIVQVSWVLSFSLKYVHKNDEK